MITESGITDARSGSAVRVDEIPFFFGDGIFGFAHRPHHPVGGCWVICSPFGKERDRTYRLMYEWARFMAAAGHWTLRFDYRGTGDSAGIFSEGTVESYLDDIAEAVTEIERISGLPCRGCVGLRLGADLAARYVTESSRDLELALWEPVVKGAKYRNVLLRTAMANEMVVSKGAHRSRADFRRMLANGETVSVDGFPLGQSMYESLTGVDSSSAGRPSSAPILIVQMKAGQGRAPTTTLSTMIDAFNQGGSATRVESIDASPVWMETRAFRWPPDELFSLTTGWISENLHGDVEPRPPSPPKQTPWDFGSFTETPIHYEVEGSSVRGVLHEVKDRPEAAPVLVMVAAGDACRSGFFYVKLARFMAGRGFNVLRFDPRGLGESDGDFECTWLVEYFDKVERGVLVPDTLAALDFLEDRNRFGTTVLVGLCGGAITSIFAAERDARVSGVAALDLPVALFRPARWDQREVSWLDVFSQRRSTMFFVKLYHFCRDCKNASVGFLRKIPGLLSKPTDGGSGGRRWIEKLIGEDANFPLMEAMEDVLDRRSPVCCVFADSTDHLERFRLAMPGFRSKRPDADALLELMVVPDSDHNFVMPGCSENLISWLHGWMYRADHPWRKVLPPFEDQISVGAGDSTE